MTKLNACKLQKHGLITVSLLRNEINSEIKHKQEAYHNNLFDGNNANKNFWKYVKTLWKDNTGIPPLRSDDQLLIDTQEKADILNEQFYSIFTNDIPE